MNPLFSKSADGLRADKRKRSQSPSLPAKKISLQDHLDHGDKETDKGAPAPVSESQGRITQPSEQAVAGTHAPSTAVYDETHPTMFGIPPGRVPEGPRAPAFESQGQFPKPHFCEQAMAGTHEASIAVYDMTRATRFGIPPGRVPDRVQTSEIATNSRDIAALKLFLDMRINHCQTTAISNNDARPYSSDPGSDFDVQREPVVAASSTADPESPKDPIS